MTAKPLHTVYRTTETENGKETIRKKVSFQPILKKQWVLKPRWRQAADCLQRRQH